MSDWIKLFKKWKTPVLGVGSLGALLYGAIVIFEVDAQVMVNILVSSVTLAVIMIVLALIVTGIRILLRRKK